MSQEGCGELLEIKTPGGLGSWNPTARKGREKWGTRHYYGLWLFEIPSTRRFTKLLASRPNGPIITYRRLNPELKSLKECLAVTAQVEADTGCEFIKCDFADVKDRGAIDELALRLGDTIHNLKCALDHAWFQTITRLVPSGDWERTKFPVYPTVDLLEGALRHLEVNVSAPKFCEFLARKIQPYKGGEGILPFGPFTN